MQLKHKILEAASAIDIPASSKGLWSIKKLDYKEPTLTKYRRLWIRKFPLDNWDIIMPELQGR